MFESHIFQYFSRFCFLKLEIFNGLIPLIGFKPLKLLSRQGNLAEIPQLKILTFISFLIVLLPYVYGLKLAPNSSTVET